jgi:hypothetical protein
MREKIVILHVSPVNLAEPAIVSTGFYPVRKIDLGEVVARHAFGTDSFRATSTAIAFR